MKLLNILLNLYFFYQLTMKAYGRAVEQDVPEWGSVLSSPIIKLRLRMATDYSSGGYNQSVRICTSINNCCEVPFGDSDGNTYLGTSYDKINVCTHLFVNAITNLTAEVRSSDDNGFKPDYVDIWTANQAQFRADWTNFAYYSTGQKSANLISSPVLVILDEELIYEVFNLFDLDKNGFITKDEMGSNESTEIKQADLNHDGKLSYEEYFWHKRETFRLFDLDGNGLISKPEISLKLIMSNLDEKLTDIDKVTKEFIKADNNKDGHITYEEFLGRPIEIKMLDQSHI